MHQTAFPTATVMCVHIQKARNIGMDRSYQTENTRSRPLPEAKQS